MKDPLTKGLPVNLDAERFLLGSILQNDSFFPQVCGAIGPDDFSLDKHRRIFTRMNDLFKREEKIDRISIANELIRYGELDLCDGISYLLALDEGLPKLSNLDGYIKIVLEKSTLRKLIFASQKTINKSMEAIDSSRDITQEAIRNIESIRGNSGLDKVPSIQDYIDSLPSGISSILEPNQGISTGFLSLDDLTGGLQPGSMTILGARPSCGKSAWVLKVAQHLAYSENCPVAIFSLEMSRSSMMERLACMNARVNLLDMRRRIITASDRERLMAAMGKLYEMPIYIDDSPSLTASDIGAKLENLIRKKGVKVALVDYVQLMKPEKNSRYRTRNDMFTEIYDDMKAVTKRSGVAMILCSQLSRDSEKRSDHRPQLSDLRESGAGEQVADLVLFLHREWLYKKSAEELKEKAECIIGKQRQGPLGTVNLRFLDKYALFENV